MNNPENKLTPSPSNDREEKDRKYFETQARKDNLKVTREFESNARKIKLGIPYSKSQLEFFFDVRFGEELVKKLRDKFNIRSNEDGSILTFNTKE
jgi:hypothetical protein